MAKNAKIKSAKPVKRKPKSLEKTGLKKLGRPTAFNQETVDEICERIACGESLRHICDSDSMPAMSSVFKWLNENEEFSEQYARAREEQIETKVDQINEIADDGSNDWMKSNKPENPGYILNGEAIQRSRLRIDAIKWQAEKIKAKKYGNATTIRGDAENPIPLKQDITLTAHEAYLKMIHGK